MTPEVNKLKVIILQNMSICTNNTHDFEATIKQCTKAIGIDREAAKAMYLRSIAQQKLGNLEEAMTDIKAAIKIAPSDKSLRS